MEPMDISEDSLGETPHKFARPRSVPPVLYRDNQAAAPLPFTSYVWQQRPRSALPQFLASSTPDTRHTRQAAIGYGSPALTARETALRDTNNSAVFSPIREPSQSQRGVTPVQSASGFRSGSAFGTGPESPDSSGRSDVSEMEVGPCSPSPSLDRITSAFQSFSVFRSPSEINTGGVDKNQTPPERKKGDRSKWSTARSSWEPGLTTVQAATEFKQGPRRRGALSRKKKLSALEDSFCEEEEEEEGLSAVRPFCPSGKLRRGKDDGEGTSKDSKARMKTEKQKAKSENKSGCWRCVKIFLVIFLVAAGAFAVFLQTEIAARRDRYAKMDTELLRNEMASNLFGQHIAMEVVPREVQNFLENFRAREHQCQLEPCQPIPPLVLSFHGWTGVGKNFVSGIISSVFPLKTLTKFLLPYHFPHRHLDETYRKQVEEWVLSNVTEYSVNFFLFDEMDKVTPGLVEGLKDAVSKLKTGGSPHSPVIILLLSNSLGSEINRKVFQAMKSGQKRESLTATDFASLFENCDDPWYEDLRSAGVITKSVPFLPLEKQHIILCIRRDLVSKKLSTKPEIISRVLNELTFTTLPSGQKFSQTGCKRVVDKVNYITME